MSPRHHTANLLDRMSKTAWMAGAYGRPMCGKVTHLHGEVLQQLCELLTLGHEVRLAVQLNQGSQTARHRRGLLSANSNTQGIVTTQDVMLQKHIRSSIISSQPKLRVGQFVLLSTVDTPLLCPVKALHKLA